MGLLVKVSWEGVVRSLRNVERRKLVEELFRKSRSIISFEVDFVGVEGFSELGLPRNVKGWDCELRLRLESGKTTGYYLSALARGEAESEESVHFGAMLDADGGMHAILSAKAKMSASGGPLPTQKPRVEWHHKGMQGNALALVLVDSLLVSAANEKGHRRD